MPRKKSSFPITLLRFAWLHRRYLAQSCAIGMAVGLLVALSIPKEYVATLLLSPESISEEVEGTGSDWTGGIVGGTKKRDAITPDFYPYIASSPDFLAALASVPVQSMECPPDSVLTLYDYMERHQRRPWWSILQRGIEKIAELSTGPSPEKPEETKRRKDAQIAAAISKRISIEPDVKKRVVALACRMQDPLIAATVLDTLNRRLQAYITDYRTEKERKELSLAKQLQQQARAAYYSAQEAQAAFEDRNRDLHTRNAQKELVQLRVKTNFAKEEYARATLRVKAAETKVIRVRPVFAVIQPATVPVRPASPSKLKYMAFFALPGLLAGYARLWWKQQWRK